MARASEGKLPQIVDPIRILFLVSTGLFFRPSGAARDQPGVSALCEPLVKSANNDTHPEGVAGPTETVAEARGCCPPAPAGAGKDRASFQGFAKSAHPWLI